MAWDSGLKVCSTMHSSSMPQKPAHSCASRRKNTFQHRSRLPALAWSLLLSPIFLQQADGWQSGWAPRVTGLQRHSPHVRYDVSLSQFLGGQHEPRKRAPGVQFVTMVSAPESRTDLRKDGSSSDDSISEKPLVVSHMPQLTHHPFCLRQRHFRLISLSGTLGLDLSCAVSRAGHTPQRVVPRSRRPIRARRRGTRARSTRRRRAR